MKNKEFSFWLRQGVIGKKCGLQIWNSFRRVKNILFQNISWFFGSGNRVLLGKDCIIGAGESPPGTVELIQHLNKRGIYVLSEWNGSIPIWLDSSQLNLADQYKLEWL